MVGSIVLLLAACGGPEEPPNPETRGVETAPASETGMTTGSVEEEIDQELPLEDAVSNERGTESVTVPDSVVGSEPLTGD